MHIGRPKASMQHLGLLGSADVHISHSNGPENTFKKALTSSFFRQDKPIITALLMAPGNISLPSTVMTIRLFVGQK